MGNIINVRSSEGYIIYNNDDRRTVSAIVEENKVYEAKLYKLTEEYFAYDSEDREFLVGEIDINGKLVLRENFELINENNNIQNRIDVYELNRKAEKLGVLSSRKADYCKRLSK